MVHRSTHHPLPPPQPRRGIISKADGETRGSKVEMESSLKSLRASVKTARSGANEELTAKAGARGDHHAASQAARQSLLKQVISFPVLVGALLVVALFVALRNFTVDPDLWWHLKVGQSILASRHWPTADPYSFTAQGAPWMAYEWLGDTLLAAAQRAWGLRGLLALDLGVAAAVVLALYVLASLRSRNSKAAFVTCAMLLPLVAVSLSLRPQMFGYLYLTLTLIILERFRQGRAGPLWLLPPLFLLWVNTHGSFVIGLFVCGIYLVSGFFEFRRGDLESARWTPGERLRLGLVFLASLIVLTITPYGAKVAAYPMDMAFSQPVNVANVQEWQSMPFNTVAGKVFLAFLVGFLLVQLARRLTWRLAELALFLAGVAAACMHMRFLMLFVPFAAPLFAVILSLWVEPYAPGKDKYLLNAFLIIAIVLGIIRFFPSETQLASRVAEHWPVKAVRYLEQHPPPRPMYNQYVYGGYLIYALDGRNKVFIDGRADIYERLGVFSDYLSIAQLAPNALALLEAYHVESCLIQHDEALATLLRASPQWQQVYSDEMSVLFVRESEKGQP